MFYVQLGPVMEDFNDQTASFISLARALFGDFDIDEILNNSRGYTNAVLFLTYLFVAVFIMLSMFLAILGENQAKVRADQDDAHERGDAPPEYGIFYHAGTCLQTAGQSVGARLMRRARPAASAEDGACDMAPVQSRDPQAEALDDINGKISNMEKLFSKLVRAKAADLGPKSPGSTSSTRGGFLGPSGLDNSSLERVVSALEQRLAPSITRAIAVELDARGGHAHGKRRMAGANQENAGNSQHSHPKRRSSQAVG